MGRELEEEERGPGQSILICLMKFSIMKRMWLAFFSVYFLKFGIWVSDDARTTWICRPLVLDVCWRISCSNSHCRTGRLSTLQSPVHRKLLNHFSRSTQLSPKISLCKTSQMQRVYERGDWGRQKLPDSSFLWTVGSHSLSFVAQNSMVQVAGCALS